MTRTIFLGLGLSCFALSITAMMGCSNDGEAGSSTFESGGASSSGANTANSTTGSLTSGATTSSSGATTSNSGATTSSSGATTSSSGATTTGAGGAPTTTTGTGGAPTTTTGVGGAPTTTTGVGGGPATTTTNTSSSSTGSTGVGGGPAGPEPDPQFVPTPTGTCPDFVEGTITVTPNGIAPRNVRIWVSSAATTLDGPLIFYWHGTGSSPVTEPPYGIGSANVTAIKAQGGIIAAPYHDPAAGQFPWFLTTGGNNEADLRVADEVLACAIQKVGIDKRHIHSMGMSAGGLNTVQMSYRRSGYLASVVTYSGGLLGNPPNQDPSNKFSAMIFHGGPSDMVVINFQTYSIAYRDALKNAGHFAFICNHNMGHSIPTGAVNSVRQFFQDHPFGTVPSPYTGGLPTGFPSYCSL